MSALAKAPAGMTSRTGMQSRPANFAPVVAVVESCPPELRREDQPRYGGSLFFHPELGRAGCGNPACGWSGAPTSHDGVISTWCPRCEQGRVTTAEVTELVPRARRPKANAKRKAARAARKKNRR